MLKNKFITSFTALSRLLRRRPRPILAKDVDLVCICSLHALATLLPVQMVASIEGDIATVDDGVHSGSALVLIKVEREIGYRYGHRVLLGCVGAVGFGQRPAESDQGCGVGYILAEIVDVVF
jgi:hypothetical protein